MSQKARRMTLTNLPQPAPEIFHLRYGDTGGPKDRSMKSNFDCIYFRLFLGNPKSFQQVKESKAADDEEDCQLHLDDKLKRLLSYAENFYSILFNTIYKCIVFD